jgi:hypothetical protein
MGMFGDVTDLKGFVLDFVNAARKRPAIGSDPGELDNLEKAALTSFTGAYGALSIPIAPETWEVQTIFLGGAAAGNFTSERIQLDVPYPVMVVGLFASLSVLTTGPGGAVAPTLSDVTCSLDLNQHEYMTDAQGNTTATNTAAGGTPTRDGTYVTLAALATNNQQGGRLIGWVIPYRTAQIGVTFRWKRGPGVFFDTIVSMAFYVRPLQPEDM